MALHRSEDNKQIMGVCQGIAEEYGLDVSIIRIVWLLLAIFTASIFAIIYLILGFILPIGEKDDEPKKEEKKDNDDSDFTF